MSDIFTVLASPLLTDLPGGESVNPNEKTAKKRFRPEVSRVQLQWNSVPEILNGIDIQLREIQLNFQEFIQTPQFSDETIVPEYEDFDGGVAANAFSALVEDTEKAIQSINQEISELLTKNSRARELIVENGVKPGNRKTDSDSLNRPLLKSRVQWA